MLAGWLVAGSLKARTGTRRGPDGAGTLLSAPSLSWAIGIGGIGVYEVPPADLAMTLPSNAVFAFKYLTVICCFSGKLTGLRGLWLGGWGPASVQPGRRRAVSPRCVLLTDAPDPCSVLVIRVSRSIERLGYERVAGRSASSFDPLDVYMLFQAIVSERHYPLWCRCLLAEQ